MIEKLNVADVKSKIDLDDGAVVLLDRLGKGDRYSKEEQAQNVLRIEPDGRVRWRVHTKFDAEGSPFTRLHLEDGMLTAYRWDGGTYGIDLDTGEGVPLVLER